MGVRICPGGDWGIESTSERDATEQFLGSHRVPLATNNFLCESPPTFTLTCPVGGENLEGKNNILKTNKTRRALAPRPEPAAAKKFPRQGTQVLARVQGSSHYEPWAAAPGEVREDPGSRLPVLCSRLPAPSSLFPAPCSLFPVLGFRFPVPGSRFPVPGSPFPVSRFPAPLPRPRAGAAGGGRSEPAPRREAGRRKVSSIPLLLQLLAGLLIFQRK